MSRLYLRLIVPLWILFTGALLLINIQPYDDHELRELLLPEGCPAPCFMCIRPGVTSVDEALNILKASGWVAQYEYEDDGASINITWNENSPTGLPHNGAHASASLWTDKGLISQLNVETTLMLGSIQLGIGQSPFQHIALTDFDGRYFLSYSAVYPNKGINVSASRNCDEVQGNITYHDKVYLHYARLTIDANLPPTYYRSWVDVIHTACR
jgi:hypothetical protein